MPGDALVVGRPESVAWARALAVALVIAIMSLLVEAAASEGWRRPTADERRAIKTAALRDCRKQESPRYKCKWGGRVRVSTINRRYAWASVSGPSYDNSGIMRRPSRQSRRWRIIRVVGGGIQPCSYWRKVAPRRVVRDLKVRGFTEGTGDFTYRRC